MTKRLDPAKVKNKVHNFWNKRSCGTEFSENKKFSKDYFEEIENHRYKVEPEIFSFAQFTRHHGQKILEVGIGAGTDFLQWVRAGAKAHGIDLTKEGITHVENRLKTYGLQAAEIKVADCEKIPYPDNTFDVVYSWGVIHHTPDTEKALSEIVRVCKPGGECKIMIYHRHSLAVLILWIRKALLRGKPWKSFSWCLYHYMESIGTKAYTKKEAQKMLEPYNITNAKINTILTVYDTLELRGRFIHFWAKSVAKLLGGNKAGWFMTIQFTKER